jgi:hypothetical protein
MELNKIQSNLSFSYLHAVVSRAGGSCERTHDDADGMGIDARLTFEGNGKVKVIDINVQLKSTRKQLSLNNGKYSFPLNADEYKKYTQTSITPFLFVLFCLPENCDDWLTLTEEQLVLRKCSYWTSLIGAESCERNQGRTIYVPEKNVFSVQQLEKIVQILSNGEMIYYES